MSQSKPERMVDQDPASKAAFRAAFSAANDTFIGKFKQIFTLTTPPYTLAIADGSQRFLKAYQLWDKSDLLKVDPNHVLSFLDHMAEMDDYAHLRQVMPNSYHGDVVRYSKDIMSAFQTQMARGVVKMSSTETDTPAPAIEVQKSAFSLKELKDQAGKLPTIALQDATDILPATVKSTASMAKAA